MQPDLPEGLEWRPDLVDRPDLCPAYSTANGVHCAVPVDEDQQHPGQPHAGLGIPAAV